MKTDQKVGFHPKYRKNPVSVILVFLIVNIPIITHGQTPTPSVTPTPTSECPAEASMFENWDVCERLQAVMTPPPSHGATKWYFDDCYYCRGPDNPCFPDLCTFAMYVVAECGRELHLPFYDVETARIRIKNCETNKYEEIALLANIHLPAYHDGSK